jgi:hypothetical protein
MFDILKYIYLNAPHGTGPLALYLAAIVITYFFTRNLLRSSPWIRQFSAGIFGTKDSFFHFYFAYLKKMLDQLKLAFYIDPSLHSPRRAISDIYATFLAIALGYTSLLFFLGWTTGGEGRLGQAHVISGDYSTLLRYAITAGVGLFAGLIWQAVVNPASIDKFMSHITLGVLPKWSYALIYASIGGICCLSSLRIGIDRFFGLDPHQVLAIELLIASIVWLMIYLAELPAGAMTIIAGASYFYALGLSPLIGVPIGLAIGTASYGSKPVLLATVLTPVLMTAYYYILPKLSQNTNIAMGVLAGISCFPVFLTLIGLWPRNANSSKSRSLLGASLVFIPMTLSVAMNSAHINDPVGFGIFVFWTIIPMLNATFDSLSWYLTWRLLDHMQRSLAAATAKDDDTDNTTIRSVLSASRKFLILAAHVLANLFVSGIVFLVTFFLAICLLDLVNIFIRPINRNYAIDVQSLLNAVVTDPYHGDGLWISMMIFITMIPAFVHLFVIFSSAVALAFQPSAVRNAWRAMQNENILGTELVSASSVAARHFTITLAFFGLVLMVGETIHQYFGFNINVRQAISAIGARAHMVGSELWR